MEDLKKKITKKLSKFNTAVGIAEALDEPRPRVSRALAAMVKDGSITKTGNTRATTYALAA